MKFKDIERELSLKKDSNLNEESKDAALIVSVTAKQFKIKELETEIAKNQLEVDHKNAELKNSIKYLSTSAKWLETTKKEVNKLVKNEGAKRVRYEDWGNEFYVEFDLPFSKYKTLKDAPVLKHATLHPKKCMRVGFSEPYFRYNYTIRFKTFK